MLVVCIMGLGCTAWADATDGDDQFRANSVWVNDDKGLNLKVIERDGDSFKGLCLMTLVLAGGRGGQIEGEQLQYVLS